jgi:sortase A
MAIAIWAASYLVSAAFRSWQDFVFESRLQGYSPTLAQYVATTRGKRLPTAEQARHGRLPEPSTLPAPRVESAARPRRPDADDGLVGRLVIPRLGLAEIVREGDGAGTLSLSLGHIPGTALPGQFGNVGVAGHRDTLFRGLRSIGKDDRIRFQTLHGSYDYQVEDIAIVRPEEVGVLAPGRYRELTLVTCYPFSYVGAAPERFVVKARQVAP